MARSDTNTNSGNEDGPSKRLLIQLIIATFPIFLVLSYFLFVAHKRPSDPYYTSDITDDALIEQLSKPQLDLLEMLYVYVAFMFSWVTMYLYVEYFVPKRRAMIQKYHDEGETIYGDVNYEEDKGCCCKVRPKWIRWSPLGGLGIMSNHYSDMVYKTTNKHNEKVTVTKMVRTYKPWAREKVSILLLPNKPRSGLPKSDVETDMASWNKSHLSHLKPVIVFWIVFLLLGSLYLCIQIGKMKDERYLDDKIIAWTVFTVMVFLVVPLGFLTTWLRVLNYGRWIMTSGEMVKESDKKSTSDLEQARRYGRMG